MEEIDFFDFNKQPGLKKEKNCLCNSFEKPLITIVSVVEKIDLNVEQFINCILNQTFFYWEWIIIINESIDEHIFRSLLQGYENKTKIFRKNGDILELKDFAIKESNSEFIFNFNSNVLIDKTTLETFYFSMITNNASMIYSNSVILKDNVLCNGVIDIFADNNCELAILTSKELILKAKGFYNFTDSYNLWKRIIECSNEVIKLNYYSTWYMDLSGKIVKSSNDNYNLKQYPYFNFLPFDLYTKKIDYKIAKINNNKKKILFVFPWFAVGGGDKFNLDLISRLDKNVFEITIVTTQDYKYIWRQKFEEYANEIYDLTTFIDTNYWSSFLEYIIIKKNIELVFISNSVYGYYVMPWLKSKFPKLPFVDYVHAEEWNWRNGGYAKDSVAVCKLLDKTYVCNKHLIDVMNEKMQREVNNIEVAYIGVDEKFFNPDLINIDNYNEFLPYKNKKIILFVCRISEEKRPIFALNVIKEIERKRDDIVLFVVGDGNILDEMKETSQNMNIKNIVFWGNQDDVRPFYKIADVTLICSLTEGLTLTTYESLSMSTPVVTSDVGGQKELVSNKTGKVIKRYQDQKHLYNREYSKEEINEYVDAIIEVIDNGRTECRNTILSGFSTKNLVQKLSLQFINMIENKSFINSIYSDNLNLFEQYLVLYNESVRLDRAIQGISEYNTNQINRLNLENEQKNKIIEEKEKYIKEIEIQEDNLLNNLNQNVIEKEELNIQNKQKESYIKKLEISNKELFDKCQLMGNSKSYKLIRLMRHPFNKKKR